MTDKRTDEKLAEWEARLCRALEKPSAAGGILRVKKSDLRSAIAEIHRLRGERDEAVAKVKLADAALANVTAFEDDARYIMGNTNFEITKHARDEARAFLAKLEERG